MRTTRAKAARAGNRARQFRQLFVQNMPLQIYHQQYNQYILQVVTTITMFFAFLIMMSISIHENNQSILVLSLLPFFHGCYIIYIYIYIHIFIETLAVGMHLDLRMSFLFGLCSNCPNQKPIATPKENYVGRSRKEGHWLQAADSYLNLWSPGSFAQKMPTGEEGMRYGLLDSLCSLSCGGTVGAS